MNPDTRLRDEYEYLRKKFGDKPREPKLFKRLVSLKARLESQENDLLLRAPKLLRQVESAAHKAELEAIEYALNKIFRNRLIEITGYAPPEVMLDRFLLNALQLMADISYNKKLLKRLLIAHLTGDTSWRENLPANRKFLETFAEKGMDTKAWLKSHPHRFEIEGLGTVRLKLEEDPLNILEMGNYFDTCLSFGGCYSYSTVANACDLNKRVIYAYDKKGRIIARQLIGVNQEFKLVGFHIYDNLNNSAVAEKVYPAFTQFVDYFASRVGIQLDNQGIIDCLTTTNWYHDGIVAWGSQTVDGQAARLVKRHKELTRAVSV